MSDLKRNTHFGDNSFFKSHVAPNLFQDYSESLLESTKFENENEEEIGLSREYNITSHKNNMFFGQSSSSSYDNSPYYGSKSISITEKKRKSPESKTSSSLSAASSSSRSSESQSKKLRRGNDNDDNLPLINLDEWMVLRYKSCLKLSEKDTAYNLMMVEELTSYFRLITMFKNRFEDFKNYFIRKLVPLTLSHFGLELKNVNKKTFDQIKPLLEDTAGLFNHEEGVSEFKKDDYYFESEPKKNQFVLSISKQNFEQRGVSSETYYLSVPKRKYLLQLEENSTEKYLHNMDQKLVFNHLCTQYNKNYEYFYLNDTAVELLREKMKSLFGNKNFNIGELDADLFFSNKSLDFVAPMREVDIPIFEMMHVACEKKEKLVLKNNSIVFWKTPYYNNIMAQEITKYLVELLKNNKNAQSFVVMIPIEKYNFNVNSGEPSDFSMQIIQEFFDLLKMSKNYKGELRFFSSVAKSKFAECENMKNNVLWNKDESDNHYPGEIVIIILSNFANNVETEKKENMIMTSIFGKGVNILQKKIN